MKPIILIGTKTRWGIIKAVGWVGERYYWIIDKFGTVSMMPASIVESDLAKGAERLQH